MGLEKEARPAERLLRKFGEFERRHEARPQDAAEPTSPALPIARPALAAKIDPFATSSPAAAQQQQSRSTASKKTKGSKMAIFSDSDEPPRPDSGGSSKGWDNIGSIRDRKKENTREAKPWAGEKLKGGKTNGGMEKMMIFKDSVSQFLLSLHTAQHIYECRTKPKLCIQSSVSAPLPRHLFRTSSRRAHDQQCMPNPKTGRMEYVFVDLEAVYPGGGKHSVEYCFEELRAHHRGLLGKQQTRRRRRNQQDAQHHEEDDSQFFHGAQSQDSFGMVEPEPEPPAQKKQRGFKIFEDAVEVPPPKPAADDDDRVLVETFSKTLALNDENDENAVPSEQQTKAAKKARKEERANRTRKIQVPDVKHIHNETKTITINMNSPTGPKLKRKKSDGNRSEPTMTINTREAMDEIYGIFNQPLPPPKEQSDGENSDSDDDYTTGDESTGTGKLSGPPSEYGDETRNELLGAQNDRGEDGRTTDVTDWSDFTASKHVPRGHEAVDSHVESTQSGTWDEFQDQSQSDGAALPEQSEEEITTPHEYEEHRTRHVPLPPEGYEPPVGQYRDAGVVANNRLPFMTPIVEQTESSLSTSTAARRHDKDYFGTKTPSRSAGAPAPLPEDDELYSSPFQEVIADNAEDKRKVLQPMRTKSTKGNIALGAGSAKSQTAAKTPDPAASDPVQKGPIIKDGQCNPMDPHLRHTILSKIKPALSTFDGYHEHLDISSGRTAEIKKFIKTQIKASRSSVNLDKTAATLSLPPMLSFKGSEGTYTIKRQLGEGTFAPVYLVENSAAIPREDVDENDENRPPSRIGKSAHRKPLEAIKMEDPPSSWEFYILRQAHRRLGVTRPSQSIVRAHEMHLFRDECFLMEEYREQGTLLDLVNIARADNSSAGGMEEAMAMWLSVELLRTVEALHAKQLIHGDLKGDNVLVRFEDPGAETDWSPTYFPSGAHGWASKGVCLIDMGRGIDMKQFVPHVAFIADWKTTEADCAEMRELRPWTYQIDYHGLAGIVHSLLFGKYMETVGEKRGASLGQGATKTYRIRESLKRYWQVDIWADVFHLLLNPLAHVGEEEGARMPVVRGMRGVRERMEAWLEENCERGVGLKGMIARMEGIIREKRRRSMKGGVFG